MKLKCSGLLLLLMPVLAGWIIVIIYTQDWIRNPDLVAVYFEGGSHGIFEGSKNEDP
jgi:hypothetical protein